MKSLLAISIILIIGLQTVELVKPIGTVAILSDSTYEAGTPIKLSFNASSEIGKALLIIRDSWGLHSMPIDLQPGNNALTLPAHLSVKTGLLDVEVWVQSVMLAKDTFSIVPQEITQPIPEVYTGPRFLIAGGTDQAMIVATPLDSLDNPLPTGTEVQYKVRGGDGVQSKSSEVDGLFAYDLFRSDRQTGIMNAYIACLESSSQEYDFFVKSSSPVDFSIIQNKLHQDADGQQLVSVVTATITDSLNNVIVDGTVVRFAIRTSSGSFSQMTAPTINGVAYAEFPFPLEPESWLVNALIPGYATSNTLTLDFEPALDEILARYNPNKNTLDIGPLVTRFGNLTADGTPLKIVLRQDDKKIELSTTTRLGIAEVDLSSAQVPDGVYDIVFTAGGKELVLKKINIES